MKQHISNVINIHKTRDYKFTVIEVETRVAIILFSNIPALILDFESF